jgi:hypothetical protein
LLTALIALAPALIAWLADRRLLARHDDPALPELIASRRRANIRAVGIAIGVMLVVGGADAAWGIPLLIAALAAAAYPVRTRLLGETWGLGRYLWHSALSFVGGFGFWLALSYAPILVRQSIDVLGTGQWPWIAAAARRLGAHAAVRRGRSPSGEGRAGRLSSGTPRITVRERRGAPVGHPAGGGHGRRPARAARRGRGHGDLRP